MMVLQVPSNKRSLRGGMVFVGIACLATNDASKKLSEEPESTRVLMGGREKANNNMYKELGSERAAALR